MFEHNKTLGISNALPMFLKQGPLFNRRLYHIMISFIRRSEKNYH